MQLDYLEADLLKVIIKIGPLHSHLSESRRNENMAIKEIKYKSFVLISI